MPLFRGQLKHIRGLTDYKDSVLVASTNNIGLTSNTTSIDGVTLSSGDRVLLTGQTTTTQNGIYTSQSDGTLERAFDADTTDEFSTGMLVYVEQGTSNGKSTWLLTTTGEIVLGTTSILFQKQSQIHDSLEGTYGGVSNSLTLGIQKNGIITTVTENTLDSDNVTEGSSNLYHTTARARSSISASGSNLSYNSTTGVMSFTLNTLTPGTGISGTNFDGTTNRTFEIDTSVVPTLSSGVSVFSNDAGYITASSTDTLTNKTIGAATISGNLIPDTTETYDLGSSSYRFNDLYLAGSTIDLGGAKLTNDGSDNLDIKDSSGNRKIIRASAIELVDTSGKKIKIERDASSGKMKSRKFDASGNAEADSDDVIEVAEDKTPQLGGDLDANGNDIDMGTNTITDTKVGQWDTAYGWGNHASSGYITDYTVTESDVTTHQAALSITESQISDLTHYTNSNVDSHLNQSNPTDGYVLSWTSGDYAWIEQSSSGIFTASGTSDTTYTHDGTKLILDLDTNNIIGSNTTNPTHTSGNTPTLSGGSVSSDSVGIFYVSASNHGTYEDVLVRTNGSGTGTAGFANPSGAASIFGFRGTSGTTTSRNITTANLNTTNHNQIKFYLIAGSSSNGGENTDAGDDFKLWYSTNGGANYTLIQTWLGSDSSNKTWTEQSVDLPAGAKASSVKFKFENLHTAGTYDHWAISLVKLSDDETVTSQFEVSINGSNIISSTPDLTTFTGSLTGNVTGNVAGSQSGGSVTATSGSFSNTLQANGNFYANGTNTYLANSTADRVYVRTPLFYLNGTQITATATEINYTDGVTSNIQTQLDTKASLTGTETLDNKTIDGGSF